jgi:energy-coupling factor transporter ATP-binding protein EcfA2
MTKIYFADRTKNFTRKVFKSLLDFAYLDEDERDRAISCSWIETCRTIKFKVSKAQLQDLYGGLHSEKTFENEIRPAITSYLKILGVIENMTTRKDLREFELHLWHETKEGNLERFDKEWDNQSKVSTKIKSVSKRKQEINWRTACQNLLDRQKQQITSSPLHRKAKDLDSVHVPLGLMKRKESERPKFDRTQEISPERGSEAYQQGYTETKRVEHDAFLAAIGQRKPGEHVVILGEPGAGKTTLLMKVWEWLLKHEQPGEDIIVAWVPLAAVKNNELEEYLHKSWIKQFCKSGEIDRYWASFEALADAGRVWLLLDGADEMGGEALRKLEVTLGEAWTRSTRAIITCRLNLWDASSTNQLQTSPNFQVYRTLDFKYVNPAGQDEVKSFIDNWFRSTKEPEAGQKLRAALDEVGKERIKDLAQNPLRLTLLCAIWDDDRALPETQAGLYELFVDYVYKWKATEFPVAVNLREELDRALGDLAKQGINKPSLRFRFTETELRKWVPVVEQCQALMDLGWLNCVGEENKRPVFAFFHPTFQEYFAACSIDDWDYFLPRAHVDRPVPCLGEDQPTYRVFESEWRQPIVLWFGRKDVVDEFKEEFIERLTNFQSRAGDFYFYRAYCMAAISVGEFISSRLSEPIVQQIVNWILAYYNSKPGRKDNAIACLARETMLFTHRKHTIDILTQKLRNSSIWDYHSNIISLLGDFEAGNRKVIDILIDSLEWDDVYRSDRNLTIASALGRIAKGDDKAIDSLEKIIKDKDLPFWRRFNIAVTLQEIDPNNSAAFTTLCDLEDYDLGMEDSFTIRGALGEFDSYSSEYEDLYYLDVLLEMKLGILIENAKLDGHIRIINLAKLFQCHDLDQRDYRLIAEALGRIGLADQIAINALVKGLRTHWNSGSISFPRIMAEALSNIAIGNQSAITNLLQIIQEKYSDSWAAKILTEALVKILTRPMILVVIRYVGSNFVDEMCKFKILFHCSQILAYSEFYTNWHLFLST